MKTVRYGMIEIKCIEKSDIYDMSDVKVGDIIEIDENEVWGIQDIVQNTLDGTIYYVVKRYLYRYEPNMISYQFLISEYEFAKVLDVHVIPKKKGVRK